MRRKISYRLKVALIIALSVGIVLSSNFRIAAHTGIDLVKIVVEHHAEIEDHGHTHEDTVAVIDAYHGHSHDVTDHDHNTAFLPPRAKAGILPTTRASWLLARYTRPDRKNFDLDRPPRT